MKLNSTSDNPYSPLSEPSVHCQPLDQWALEQTLTRALSRVYWRQWLPASLTFHVALTCLLSLFMHFGVADRARADESQSVTATAPDPGTPPSPIRSTADTAAPQATSAETNNEPSVAAEVSVPTDLAVQTESAQKLEPESPTTDARKGAEQTSHVETAVDNDAGLPSGFVRGPHSAPSVRELSVAPETKPLLPADRPAWVGASPDLSTSTHRLFVGSYPTSSVDEVDDALDEPLVAAVNGYIDETVLDGKGARRLGITADFIRKNLLDPSTAYMAELATSQGSMAQKWVVLKITPDHRKHFQELYRQGEQQKRLVGLGLGLLGVLGLTAAGNVAFNRRRRRYQTDALPPGTSTLTFMHEEAPVVTARKRSSAKGWILGGGVVCLTLFVVGNLSIVPKRGATRTATVEHYNAYPYPVPVPTVPTAPMAPSAPTAPQIFLDGEAPVEIYHRSNRFGREGSNTGTVEIRSEYYVE